MRGHHRGRPARSREQSCRERRCGRPAAPARSGAPRSSRSSTRCAPSGAGGADHARRVLGRRLRPPRVVGRRCCPGSTSVSRSSSCCPGFLLARPYLARGRRGCPHPGTGRYHWKRLLRIYPVYVVTVVLALTLIPRERRRVGPRTGCARCCSPTSTRPTGFRRGSPRCGAWPSRSSFYLVLPLLMLLALGRPGACAPAGWSRCSLRHGRVQLLVAPRPRRPWSARDRRLAELWLPAFLTWFAVGIGLGARARPDQARSGRPRRSPACDALARHRRELLGRWSAACCWSPPPRWPARRCCSSRPTTESLTKHLLVRRDRRPGRADRGRSRSRTSRYARLMSVPGAAAPRPHLLQHLLHPPADPHLVMR